MVAAVYVVATFVLVETIPGDWVSDMHREQIAFLLSSIKVLAGFVLGTYIANVVGLWRARRTAYVSFLGANRRTIMICAASIRAPETASPAEIEAVNEARSTLARWMVLGLDLAVAKARGVLKDPALRAHLERGSLLERNEWDSLVPGEPHNTVWFWMTDAVNRLAARQLLTNPYCLNSIVEAIANMRDKGHDMKGSVGGDLPYPYVMLVKFFVQVVMITNVIYLGFQGIPDAAAEPSSGAFTPFASGRLDGVTVSVLLFTVLTLNCALHATTDLHILLETPFGKRRVDLPHEPLLDEVRRYASILREPPASPNCGHFPEVPAGMARLYDEPAIGGAGGSGGAEANAQKV